MGGRDRFWRWRTRRLRTVGLFVLFLFCGHAAADEEEDAARQFAREELLRVAAEQVAPGDPSVGGIDDLRRATEAARERLTKLLADEARTPQMHTEEPETLKDPLRRLDELIGLTEKAPGGPTEGLIRQAARLYRYVTGELLDSEQGTEIVESKPGPEEEDGETTPGDDKETSADGEAPKEEGEDGPPKKDDTDDAGDGEQPPGDPQYGTDYMPAFLLHFGEEQEDIELSPVPPATQADRDALLAKQASLPESLRDGELRIRYQEVARRGAPAATLIKLRGIEELAPHIGREPSQVLPRWVLVRPNELLWKWGTHYVNWRRWQVEIRRRTFQQEETKGLVNDAQVEQKELRAERFAHNVSLLEKYRDETLRSLEEMRAAERYWLDEADRLELRTEELGQQCDNCSPDEYKAFKAQHDLARLRGTLVQQELRLLYITALRAGKRLEFLEESLKLTKDEAQLAKTVHQRFVDARNRARRGRQLASLQLQRGDLRDAIKEARGRAEGEGEEARWGDLATELERLARINEELQSLVQTRRRLEQSAAPPAAGPASPEASPAKDEKAKETAATAATSTDLPVTLRRPGDYFIDSAFVADARKHLGKPEFDRDLVAQHHAVVDDVVKDLQDAMTGVEDLAARQSRIESELAGARKEFGLESPQLWKRWPVRKMYRYAYREGKNLKRMEATFDVTMRGIREQQDRIRGRIEVLRSYRDQLEGLGVRSFGIRTDRTLSIEGLQAAREDTSRALGKAGDWLTLEGDDHGGHFVQRNWQAVALLALAIFASFLIVRLARGAIDRTLQRLVTRISHLPDETVAISSEAAEVREQRAAAENARREAEKAALAEASGEAERKRAVSGGGEGGGE